MDDFKKAVLKIALLSEGSYKDLEQICTTKSYKKNEFVLKENAVCDGFYFVKSGLLRIFYHKQDKEISEWFAFENTFCFSIISYFKNTPSHLIIQCIEDSEVLTVTKKALNILRNRNFEIANFAYELVSSSLIISQVRMASIQFETAIKRYEDLLSLHPSMIQRIPLHFIASYLGVSAETLSRIRAQIH